MANAEQLRKDSLADTIAAHQSIEPVDLQHEKDIGDRVRIAFDEARHLSAGAPTPFDVEPVPPRPPIDRPPPLMTTAGGSVTHVALDELSDDEMFAEHDQQDTQAEGEDESEFEFEDNGGDDDPEPPEQEEEPGKEKPKPKPKPKAKPVKKKKKR